MIGRERERARCRELLDRVRAGAGGLLLILGEPGIGKSTLLDDLARYAGEHGVSILRGRAVEGGGTYRPLAEALMGPLRREALTSSDALRPFGSALGRLLPGWSGDVPPETSVDPSLVLGEGALRLLEQYARAGCLLALEDLHWADRDSLAVLTYLADAAPHEAVLIAATVRDQPRVPGLDRLIRLPSVTTIELRRLEHAEIDRLIDATDASLGADERELVRARSEGVPLLVSELLAGGVDPAASGVPPSFAVMVEERIAALPRPARDLLATASILGERPDWDLVTQLCRIDSVTAAAGLREAVRAHLLVSDGFELRWRHALTCDAVRASLLPPERSSLSRRVAEALLARHGPDPAAADLLTVAGETSHAAEMLMDIADREMSRGALRSAEALLERAGSIAGNDARLARSRVELYTHTGRLTEALALGSAALGRATGDAHAELALRLARAAIAAARWPDAEEFLDLAGRPEDVRTLVLRSDAAHGAGRLSDAVELADRAVEASSTSSPEVRCEALCVRGRLARYTDRSAARDAFGRAAQLAAEQGLRPWRVEALLGLGTIETLEEEDASRVVEARQLARDLGLLAAAADMDVLLADHALVTEGPAAMAETIGRLTEAGQLLRLPVLQAMADQLLAMQAAMTGDLAATEARLGDVSGLPPDAALQRAGVRALSALVAHDLPTARRHLDSAAQSLLSYPSAAPLYDFGLWALLSTAVDGVEQARAGLRGIPAGQRRANAGALAYADAIAAGRSGDGAAAQRLFDEGERLLAPIPWWHRLLRLIALESAVADSWGSPVPPLRVDLAVFEERGEESLARWCRDLLRRAGSATRRGRGNAQVPPPLRAVGVTSRELDVLALLAEGEPNAEIARRLFLSPRTVETHVASLLAKSGTTNRAELRDWYAAQTR